jgi:hypothetical protein
MVSMRTPKHFQMWEQLREATKTRNKERELKTQPLFIQAYSSYFVALRFNRLSRSFQVRLTIDNEEILDIRSRGPGYLEASAISRRQ